MSTGMRKWMEKDCPDTPPLPSEVSIGREELRQLRDELAQYKNERDALRARIEEMEQQKPVGWFARIDGDGPLMECKHADISRVPLYFTPGAKGE